MPHIEQRDGRVNHPERRGMTDNSADVHIGVLFVLGVRPVCMNGVGCLRVERPHGDRGVVGIRRKGE